MNKNKISFACSAGSLCYEMLRPSQNEFNKKFLLFLLFRCQTTAYDMETRNESSSSLWFDLFSDKHEEAGGQLQTIFIRLHL